MNHPENTVTIKDMRLHRMFLKTKKAQMELTKFSTKLMSLRLNLHMVQRDMWELIGQLAPECNTAEAPYQANFEIDRNGIYTAILSPSDHSMDESDDFDRFLQKLSDLE